MCDGKEDGMERQWKKRVFRDETMVAWVPLLLAVTIPRASTRLLPALGGRMTRNDRWIQVGLGFGFGIRLVAKGVSGL